MTELNKEKDATGMRGIKDREIFAVLEKDFSTPRTSGKTLDPSRTFRKRYSGLPALPVMLFTGKNGGVNMQNKLKARLTS